METSSDLQMSIFFKVRSKMIGSLSEIKSTNMESLNQVTSAMTQATQVNDEVDPQAQVTSADTLSHVGKMLGSHDDDDVGFDSMESSADSFFSAFGNVVGMVSSSAAQTTKTKTNSSIAPVNNQDKVRKTIFVVLNVKFIEVSYHVITYPGEIISQVFNWVNVRRSKKSSETQTPPRTSDNIR